MLEVGMYVRTDKGLLGKLLSKEKDGCGFILKYEGQYNKKVWSSLGTDSEIIKASNNIIDLIEYMDLLNIENPIKLYDKEIEVSLFNPVRCDGFTTYEDGTTCIILNLDYFVDVKTLKIKSVLTHEQCKANEYIVKE